MNARFATVGHCAVCTSDGMTFAADRSCRCEQGSAEQGSADHGTEPLGGDKGAARGSGPLARYRQEDEMLVGCDNQPFPSPGQGQWPGQGHPDRKTGNLAP